MEQKRLALAFVMVAVLLIVWQVFFPPVVPPPPPVDATPIHGYVSRLCRTRILTT